MDASPVTLMAPADLLFRLDGSVDTAKDWCDHCEDYYGDGMDCKNPDDHWQDALLRKLDEKYDECYSEFIESIVHAGIQKPICVAVTEDGRWIHGNGHHRTAVAVMENIDLIPVIFSFTENFMLMRSTSDPRLPNFEGDEYVEDFYSGGKFSEKREGEDEVYSECEECYEPSAYCVC
jgi:hypothetical protein